MRWWRWERAGLVLALAYASLLVTNVARQGRAYQWDFQTYYAAAQAFRAGLDPYDTVALSRAAGHGVRLPFVYPPFALPLLCTFTIAPLDIALWVFLLLKIAALLALVRIWMRSFLPDTSNGTVFIFFCAVAFNGAVYNDIATGNITIFEQLALWAGLAALLERRYARFALMVALASLFKLTLAVFLGLCLFTERPARWRTVLAACGALGAVHTMCALCLPGLYERWLGVLPFASGAGAGANLNPSSWVLVSEVVQRAGRAANLGVPVVVPIMAYAAFVTIAGYVTYRVAAADAQTDADWRRRSVMLACLAYVVVNPRTVPYSYVMLVAPGYYVIEKFGNVSAGAVLLALACISFGDHPRTSLPGLSALSGVVMNYYALLLAYAAWLLWVRGVWPRSVAEHTPIDALKPAAYLRSSVTLNVPPVQRMR